MAGDEDRSFEALTEGDLERLGRVAEADLDRFFGRNPARAPWRDRVALIALAQGRAEHYVRSQRGVRDIDIVVFFLRVPGESALLRRQVVTWDWGPSRFGRCPTDPPTYSGRAVDVKYWVVDERADPIEAVTAWLPKHRGTADRPMVGSAPIVGIRPRLGEVIWDPGPAPPPPPKTKPHGRPAGLAPR